MKSTSLQFPNNSSTPVQDDFLCKHCGGMMWPWNKYMIRRYYCSNACRQAAYRVRKQRFPEMYPVDYFTSDHDNHGTR